MPHLQEYHTSNDHDHPNVLLTRLEPIAKDNIRRQTLNETRKPVPESIHIQYILEGHCCQQPTDHANIPKDAKQQILGRPGCSVPLQVKVCKNLNYHNCQNVVKARIHCLLDAMKKCGNQNIKMADSAKAPAPSMGIDLADLVKRLVKYALEGLAVAVACYLLPGKKLRVDEIGTIALTALAVFAILDIYAPSVGSSARTGAGFGIGANLVGFPRF